MNLNHKGNKHGEVYASGYVGFHSTGGVEGARN